MSTSLNPFGFLEGRTRPLPRFDGRPLELLEPRPTRRTEVDVALFRLVDEARGQHLGEGDVDETEELGHEVRR